MNEALKISLTLFLSLFGLSIYCLHKYVFLLGFFKSFLLVLFSGGISSLTIFVMACSYKNAKDLQEYKQKNKTKTIFETISKKLTLFFSFTMIATFLLFAVAIFGCTREIIGNSLSFFNLKGEFYFILNLFILVNILLVQMLPQKIKNRLNIFNTIVILSFCFFLAVIFFKKSYHNEIFIPIDENTVKKEFCIKEALSTAIYTFSCQHICIATLCKLKDNSYKNLTKVILFYFTISCIGVYFLSFFGYFAVRNEKIFDISCYKKNFLFEMSNPESFFIKNFLIKTSKTFQAINFIFIGLMCNLFINSITIMVNVVIRGVAEFIRILFPSLHESYTLPKWFIFIFTDLLILALSCKINPGILIKYVSIISGNTICLIIPGLMYFLCHRKMKKYEKREKFENILYAFSILLIMLGFVSMTYMII